MSEEQITKETTSEEVPGKVPQEEIVEVEEQITSEGAGAAAEAQANIDKAEAQNEANKDEALEKYLENEYGEETVEYTDDDLGGGFITESGVYHGFVTGMDVQKVVRKNKTKTKPEGSIFFWLKPVIQAKEKMINGVQWMPQGGNVWPSIRYEPGSMLDYEKFCISAKCKAFNAKDGSRKYYPRAEYTKGGAVGMPITFTVEMKTRIKMVKSDISGDYIADLDDDGNEKKQPYADVLSFAPWDTDKRWEEKDTTPDIDDDDF